MDKPNYKILVIDDNPMIHKDFRKIFTKNTHKRNRMDSLDELFLEEEEIVNPLGHIQIDSCYSGQEGLLLIQKSIDNNEPYSVAFVDIRMPPGWDGIETVSRIFDIEPNIQIIICSAYSDYSWENMLVEVQHKGRWLLLKKPIDITEVRQMTLALCEKWLLQLDMKGQIEKKTRLLREANKKLELQVKKLISAKEEIKYLAYYDTLTGLPNRFFFKEILEQSLLDTKRNNKFLSVFFLDLDDFKKINDTLGHTAGDLLLKQVSNRLSGFLRASDFVSHHNNNPQNFSMASARLGGDEFTIIIKNINKPEELRNVANRIINVIGDPPYLIENNEININTSIGISVYPRDGTDSVTLIKHADMAMYQAKEHGKNKFNFFDKYLHRIVVEKIMLEQGIRKGLEKKEFFLEYQPKVSISTNAIIGCEALLRWKHPEKGILLPIQFIPVAEESDLILKIDHWVLREACAQIRKWQDVTGFNDIITSINISARLFNDPDIVTIVSDAIQNTGIHANSLELEITESMLLNTGETTIKRLNDLRHLLNRGVKISVDDFGIGYSSLNYLGKLPLDTLKIDHSFVDRIGIDVNQTSIIKAIINLSHELKLNVIAEGVETQDQFAFLKKAGCDEIQGYILAKPMSAAKFIRFVKNWRKSGGQISGKNNQSRDS
ncbi:EAL domain-containing protein [Legionella spiritensis]|uniref:Inner membrane protein/sensory box protein LssE n=1 Tax=Legionella spiritensis TaxID=452 RepID=A0A0W0ZAG7_LEGSP|nr:EAL domain-containing protein [Legionella spiritensis]KTD66117.1 inner membrane protein/sensory box protein LssE [Legionella spiritensis]SNV44085.1 inner membrane protein PLUS sensory box protein LssE [Legionella spiritensis]